MSCISFLCYIRRGRRAEHCQWLQTVHSSPPKLDYRYPSTMAWNCDFSGPARSWWIHSTHVLEHSIKTDEYTL
jgi:hypothetical protein